MHKKVFVAMATLLFVLIAWASGDPWKQKPYEQWNKNDLRRILDDSPWAHLQRVNAAWRVGEDNKAERSSGIERAPGDSVAGSYGASGPAPASGVDRPSDTANAPTVFLVRWNSARTIREALVRGAILDGRMNQAEGEKLLAQPSESYEVAVLGPDMMPFAQADEKTLKEKTYLEAKKSKQKVAPTSVSFQRGSNGAQVSVVLFSFSKKAPNGEELISNDEKSVEFRCRLRELDLSVGFDPRKMADNRGRDL